MFLSALRYETRGGGGDKTHYVFSYGSNNSKQLRERLAPARPEPEPAFLADHARIFAGYSRRWEGAVSSVTPSKGKRVYGSLFKLTDAQLELLDRYEGGYTRTRVSINVSPTKKVGAFVYVKDNTSYQHPPSAAYLEAIHTMLAETDRKHCDKIMVRAVNQETGRLSVKGSWTPTEGLQLK